MVDEQQKTQKIELLREKVSKFNVDENTLKQALIKNGWNVERAYKFLIKNSNSIVTNTRNRRDKHGRI